MAVELVMCCDQLAGSVDLVVMFCRTVAEFVDHQLVPWRAEMNLSWLHEPATAWEYKSFSSGSEPMKAAIRPTDSFAWEVVPPRDVPSIPAHQSKLGLAAGNTALDPWPYAETPDQLGGVWPSWVILPMTELT